MLSLILRPIGGKRFLLSLYCKEGIFLLLVARNHRNCCSHSLKSFSCITKSRARQLMDKATFIAIDHWLVRLSNGLMLLALIASDCTLRWLDCTLMNGLVGAWIVISRKVRNVSVHCALLRLLVDKMCECVCVKIMSSRLLESDLV